LATPASDVPHLFMTLPLKRKVDDDGVVALEGSGNPIAA
jgi:hypothetical protein